MVFKGRCGPSEQSDLKREPLAGSSVPLSVQRWCWNSQQDGVKLKNSFPFAYFMLHWSGLVSSPNGKPRTWGRASRWPRAWWAGSPSWPCCTVPCRGRSEWTVGTSCSPSGCRLSSELPGTCWRWAHGGSARWRSWCGNPGLSAARREQRVSAPNSRFPEPNRRRSVTSLGASLLTNSS